MNIRATEYPLGDLISQLVDYTQREIAAWAADSTQSVNRNVLQIRRRLELLKATTEGRAALEELMEHEWPEVRLRAARAVLKWAPDKAIPVLGRLVAEWRPANPKKGYVPVAFDAGVSLYEHWGIRSYNRDDLIEPLARYGVELARRH